MATRKQLIDDIILRIYSSKPSDDIELEERQVAYWIDQVRNSIVSDKINERIKRSISSKRPLIIDPIYQERESCLSLTKEDENCYDIDCTDYRYYFETTKDIMPLIDDKGIVRVNDKFGRNLAPTNSVDMEWLQNLPYGGVSKQKQAFYREEGNKIFVEKSTDYTQELYTYDIVYIPMTGVDSVSDTDTYPLEEDLLPVLLDIVEEIARRQMSGLSDEENDSEDPYHETQEDRS